MASPADLKAAIDELIANAGDIFRTMDVNEDNTVTMVELKSTWGGEKAKAEAAGESARAAVYQQLMEHSDVVDKNDDNRISMVEFITFYDKLKSKYE